MKEETINISWEDAEKLGVSWEELCARTGLDIWARNEGMKNTDLVEVPIDLIHKP